MPVPPSRPEGHHALVRLGVAAALGLLFGLSLVFQRCGGAANPRLRLYGEDVAAGTHGADAAVARAEVSLQGWFNLALPDGSERRISKSELGAALDPARFRRLIAATSKAAGFPSSKAAEASAGAIDLIVPVVVDRARALALLLALKEEIDQPAADARAALDSGGVIPDRAGHRLDVDCSLDALERALERGAAGASLCFRNEPARRRASEIAGVRHDVVLGHYEASFDLDADLDADLESRHHRVDLRPALARLDGSVLPPGAVFDFNAALGRLDDVLGDRAMAALVASGEVGEGSGISAVAGTLHAAASFAGLDVVERHLPPRRSAIDVGLDAAAAYPVTNLRLANPYPFPVVLRATLARGRLRAEFRGPHRPHTISIVRKIDRAIPFAEIESADPTLERGARIVAQRGVVGVELHRYRIRRDGAHAIREASRDHYPPTPQLVRVGTALSRPRASRSNTSDAFDALTAGRPQLDTTPSGYLADELLVISQTADVDAPLVEQRIAGRATAPEWLKNIGAPAWNLARRGGDKSRSRPGAGEFFGD